jgi:hypothetical protein
MNNVLKDFSTAALSAANKANLFGFFEYLGSSSASNVKLHESAEIKYMLTGMHFPFLNNVLHTRIEKNFSGKRITEILRDFRSQNVHHLTWWVEPDDRPASLGADLLANGLTYSPGMPAMAVDLKTINQDIPATAGLTIEIVKDEQLLGKWVQPGLIGFGDEDLRDGDLCFNLFNGLGFDLPLRLYVAFLEGEPVAASQLFLDAGVAGLYWVATVPSARKQGIGAAISLAPMLDARQMGYQIGILQASSMGEGIYRRLGFQTTTRFSNYVWQNDA